jgi:hypothetical protein
VLLFFQGKGDKLRWFGFDERNSKTFVFIDDDY